MKRMPPEDYIGRHPFVVQTDSDKDRYANDSKRLEVALVVAFVGSLGYV